MPCGKGVGKHVNGGHSLTHLNYSRFQMGRGWGLHESFFGVVQGCEKKSHITYLPAHTHTHTHIYTHAHTYLQYICVHELGG